MNIGEELKKIILKEIVKQVRETIEDMSFDDKNTTVCLKINNIDKYFLLKEVLLSAKYRGAGNAKA